MRRVYLGLIAMVLCGGGLGALLWHFSQDEPAARLRVTIAATNDAPVVRPQPIAPAPIDSPIAPELPGKPETPPAKQPEAALDQPNIPPDKKPEPASILVREGKSHALTSGTVIDSPVVSRGGTLSLPAGQVTVRGDVTGSGSVIGGKESTLVLEGDQVIDATLTIGTAVLRGGTKYLRGKAVSQNQFTHAKDGQANLVIEAGTTLVIEKGASWHVTDNYAFQVGGTLVIDGGEFRCAFANQNSDYNDSWLPGSELSIRDGSYIGSGDQDFSGASITIFGGSLLIDDDIWNSGDNLDIRGGLMRNTTGGGMFSLTGNVRMTGGKLQVYQRGDRGLRFPVESSVYCTGGEVEITGGDVSADKAGIVLRGSPYLNKLTCNSATRIHVDSQALSSLTINDLVIAKGKKFLAAGFSVSAPWPDSEGGVFVP